jgi:hypothetical protein
MEHRQELIYVPSVGLSWSPTVGVDTIAILMTSLRALQAQNIHPLHPAVLERENDTGLVVKKITMRTSQSKQNATHMAWADSRSARRKRGVIMKVKTRERENVGDARIEMVKMKRVRIETCMPRTMKGIKVKEKKKNRS